MIIRPKVFTAALIGAFAASAISAWAMHELQNSTLVPAWKVEEPAPAPAQKDLALLPNETVVEAPPATTAPDRVAPERISPEPIPGTGPVMHPAPSIPKEPSITITEPRLTVDQRIQADVMDVVTRMPNLSGQIGVVSEDSVVKLSGWTSTSGQAMRVGREAGRVVGVKYVVNEIRPKTGAITF